MDARAGEHRWNIETVGEVETMENATIFFLHTQDQLTKSGTHKVHYHHLVV